MPPTTAGTQQARGSVRHRTVQRYAAMPDSVFLTMGDYPDVLGAIGPFGAQAVFFVLLTLPVGLHLYLSESGPAQATWGKRRMGLVVRSLDGGRPGRGQVAIRTVVKLLPWEISHTLIGQMQAVFYRSGHQADVSVWIFVGLGAVDVAILVYLGTSLFGRQRRPHGRASRTIVVESEAAGP